MHLGSNTMAQLVNQDRHFVTLWQLCMIKLFAAQFAARYFSDDSVLVSIARNSEIVDNKIV
jgi:hypothetical protein